MDEYFVTLLRYIHLNPVKAHMVQHPEEYAWSSHCAYLGAAQIAWVTTESGLSLFGSTIDSARTQAAAARRSLRERSLGFLP
ncbi:hypothetical protein [Povalibacter sp.]|uniref:hypothetical protein n=1 Tax=Povalibacter sp. TaxID=1962978 RepID=UPI002F3F41C7